MLIAARNGFLAEKRLPYDAEVEYLEATGNTADDNRSVWIPTDVILFNNPIIEISVQPTSFSTFSWVAGARSFDRNTFCNVGVNTDSGYPRAVYGRNVSRNAVSALSMGRFNVVKMTKGALIVDGATRLNYSSQSITTQLSSGPGLALFTCSQMISGSVSCGIGLTGRIAWCKVWNDDGATLVGDFTMVRKDGVGYAYNKINGMIYGATNGALVIGPDK